MDYPSARAKLIDQLRPEVRDERVLQAMARLPRELFVPLQTRPMAYNDRPLPIGLGQTISQPFIVALMTSALKLSGQEKVLEVGTGSGYQAAILAQLARQVFTVERLPQLAQEARKRLQSLGYNNVTVIVATNSLGWGEAAPYDAILVTAAAPAIPRELVRQLKLGGRMVLPVGGRQEQELLKVIKKTPEVLMVERLGACRFVPLIGPGGWGEEEDGF